MTRFPGGEMTYVGIAHKNSQKFLNLSTHDS